MAQYMMEIGIIIPSQGLDSIFGKMEVNILENGRKIRWMV